MTELYSKASRLVERICANNIWRQRECFNLIPSESTPSTLVRMCEICDPAGRYAEHRSLKGKEIYFYQGIEFIRDVEEEVKKEMARYFECTEVEPRPVSGQMANEIVFKALTKYVNRGKDGSTWRRIRSVMNNDLNKGGHLSSQPMGALFNYVSINPETGKENVVNFPVQKDNFYRTDIEKLEELIMQNRPELIVFGKSMFICREPVREVAEIVSGMHPRPIIMYDMAHVLGLYGYFQDPLKEGADIVTGSTHKTFFGPQRGIIVSNMSKGTEYHKLWIDIRNRAFPGSTSNHHLGTLLGLLMAVYEMNHFKQEYQQQVGKNAKALARALVANGLEVEGDPENGYTETHQVLVRVAKHGSGEEIAARLEANNIIVNYQALPDDESFVNCSGIRLGVQEMTRFGMKERDFEKLAEYMADIIVNNSVIKNEIVDYRQKFLKMQYCLEPEQASELIGKILDTLLPQ